MLNTTVTARIVQDENGLSLIKSKSTSQTNFMRKFLGENRKLGADTLVDLNMDKLCFYCERELVLWIKKENPNPITCQNAASYLTSLGVLDASLFVRTDGISLSKSARDDRIDAFSAMIVQFTKHPRFAQIVKNIITNKRVILANINPKEPDFSKIATRLLYSNMSV